MRPLRVLRDAPAAATVTTRHLLRGTDHVASLPRPWLARPAYAAALEAYRRGDLLDARDGARRAGPAGRVLARLIDGEVGVLEGLDGQFWQRAGETSAVLGWSTRSTGYSSSRPGTPSTPRVLHLVTNAQPETVAGYTVRTRGITAAQREAGLDVHVVSRLGFPVNRGRLGVERTTVVDGVPHHRLLPRHLPLRADDALRVDIEATARLVADLRPSVLHAHSNHLNARVGLAMRERFGLPLVYEVRGLLEETWLSRTADPAAAESDFYRLTRAAELRAMRAADAVVTLSVSLRSALIERGVPAERIVVVPNCVDDRWLAEPPVTPTSGAPLTIGFGGTLNAYEGVEVLIEAVRVLRAAGDDVQLLVCGDGPAATELRAVAAPLGDAVRFTGRLSRDDLTAAYRTLDVFCVPRHDLPVTRVVPPLKPVEAMALGLPVVGSDLPPLRELLAEGRGLLVRPGDPAALAQALARLDDVRSRTDLGAEARSWVARTRTWSSAAGTYRDLYDALLTPANDLATDPTTDPAPDPTPAWTQGETA